MQNDSQVSNIYQHSEDNLDLYLDILMPPNGLCLELCSGTAPLARAALRMGFNCISIDKFVEQSKNAQDITVKFVKGLERKDIEELDPKEKTRKKKKNRMKKIPEDSQEADEEQEECESQQQAHTSGDDVEIIPETQQSQQGELAQQTKFTCVSCLLELSSGDQTSTCDGCSGKCHSLDCISTKEFEGKKYTFCKNCTLCEHCEETIKKDSASYCVDCKMTFCPAHTANGKNVPGKGWLCGVCVRKQK